MSAIVAAGLGKRYGSRWALRDCGVDIPAGRITALVGPNGAGKTTLLHLATGLLAATEGSITVLGLQPRVERRLIRRIGFVAQDVPLYRSFRVSEMLGFGRHLNPNWDDGLARGRLKQLDIPLDQRVGHLSGGQRAQVSLALALAKRPEVLLLDEPLASLDPLARREFLQTLMESAAESGLTVVLSSHLVADLERVCDHLVVLSLGHTQVAGNIDDLLNSHRLITGPQPESPEIAGVAAIVQEAATDRQLTLLVRTNGPIPDPAWSVDEVGLEDLVIGYLGRPLATALPAPRVTAPAEAVR